MKRWGNAVAWLIAVVALGFLAAMVVEGAMPVQRQLVRSEANGVLRLAPEQIRRVELASGAERLTLLRTGDKRWTQAGGREIDATAGGKVSMAVQMLHRSGPVREIAAAELAGVDQGPFALETPRVVATLYEAGEQPVMSVRFGATNPEGFLQYMRIEGDGRLFLMSRFIGQEWLDAMNAALGR
jgi:hypothetical protein